MTQPQQRWWWFTKRTVIAFGLRFTNRAIIVFGLLLCVALAVGGAYLLGPLELVGLLHRAGRYWHNTRHPLFVRFRSEADID